MAEDPELIAELRGRGMSDSEIEAALRKRKRRAPLAFSALKTRHLADHPINTDRYPKARLPADLCTVEAAAARLQLHPKTVLRFIREGRLKANRIGKAYRILVSDLEAFAGIPEPANEPTPPAEMTAILDVPGVSADLARKWSSAVTTALHGRRGPPLRADVIYEPGRSHLKIVVTGPATDTLDLMSLVRVWLEQLRP